MSAAFPPGGLFYSAIVVFIATCLSIAAGRVMADSLLRLPVVLAIVGTLLMLSEGAWMVAESHSDGETHL